MINATARQLAPSDLRAEIARCQIRLYELAATVGVHPGRLGMMLNERMPMPDAVASRIAEALEHGRGAR